jgi:hypothetical protein
VELLKLRIGVLLEDVSGGSVAVAEAPGDEDSVTLLDAAGVSLHFAPDFAADARASTRGHGKLDIAAHVTEEFRDGCVG